MTYEDKIRAIENKDAAYNGIFYVAVKTTGIVCLPSCPAKPLLKNTVFYESLKDALADGYRPCKRCKPELFNR